MSLRYFSFKINQICLVVVIHVSISNTILKGFKNLLFYFNTTLTPVAHTVPTLLNHRMILYQLPTNNNQFSYVSDVVKFDLNPVDEPDEDISTQDIPPPAPPSAKKSLKPIKCFLCDKRLSTEMGLTIHLVITH